MLENNDNENISVSIGDIVKELSNLTGIKEENIGVNIETYVGYWGKRTLDELASMINSKEPNYFLNYDENKKINITIYSNKAIYSHNDSQMFCYDIEKDFDLNEIQEDDKTLLDHCTAHLYYSDTRECDYTGIAIDKDIENIKYNVKFNDLVKNDIKDKNNKFYPVSLFREAIINCLRNKKYNNYQKKIKR